MKFKDKIALVTGSTRGIGKEIASAFAQEGATTIIMGRNADTAQSTHKELVKKGLKADSFACDVTNPQNVQEIVQKIIDKYKRVDILVNNAGITKDNLLFRMSDADWDEVMSVNLKGVFNCTKAVLKVMLKAKTGRIINISSIIGIIGNVGQANYAASKAGIIGFTKSIALEMASRGITVNAIAPGYIETDMTAQLKDTTREALLKGIPLGRFGSARDIAGACLFLASDEANYITGQTIVVDGGMAV
ncbi:MAG TPA: 3-oxoacyl-[acyl-carrier-protein] reductase [Candidatus Omnitrophota bacterium]|nr:3-oxoacyl-[acyl-carrier-protein] reductase [Candidatus Omnitrophota bacterium]